MGVKKNKPYAIFGGPGQHGGSGIRYLSVGATSAESGHEAAKFFAITDAIDFAECHNIVIGGLQYVGIEDFNDLDLQSYPAVYRRCNVRRL